MMEQLRVSYTIHQAQSISEKNSGIQVMELTKKMISMKLHN